MFSRRTILLIGSIYLFCNPIISSVSGQPTTQFSFRERFQKIIQEEENHGLYRQKRQLFVLPADSAIEVKWSVNFPFTTEEVYKSTLQIAIPTSRTLDDFYLKDDEDPPFDELFGTKGGRKRRDTNNMDRIAFYKNMENLLDSHGYPGKACILRTICETAEAPMHFGIMGDFFNLALTPSVGAVTSEEGDLTEHLRAESVGKRRLGGGCHLEYGEECNSSLFDIMPLVTKKLHF